MTSEDESRRTVREVLVHQLTGRDEKWSLSVEQAETLIENLIHQECPGRLAVQWLLCELLDEAIPAGELIRYVRSVRRSIREGETFEEVSPLHQLAARLMRELIDEEG